MLAYILISYGPRPQGSLSDAHSGARVQRRNLRNFVQSREDVRTHRVVCDYCRKPKNLDSLPQLAKALSEARRAGISVLIDDFRRLFAHVADREQRMLLYDQLKPYGDIFYSIRTQGKLSELSEHQLLFHLSASPPIRYSVEPCPSRQQSLLERRWQTAKAIEESIKVRGERADEKALALAEIFMSLKTADHGPTYQQIAEEANRQGIRTTRGNDWSAATVYRSLKRFERFDAEGPVSGSA